MSTSCWSPSGSQFVLTEADIGLWPLSQCFAHAPVKHAYFLVDARSGEKRSFDALCSGLPQMPSNMSTPDGWYDKHVFAFRNERDTFFADIESRQVRQCKMPLAPPSVHLGNWPMITQRGIFELPEGDSINLVRGGVRLLRYAPDLSQAESLILHGIAMQTLGRIAASEDGQLLLMEMNPNFLKHTWYLARLADGAMATLLISGEDGLLPKKWEVQGFIPGTHQILLYRTAEVELLDADSHDLRRIPLAQADGRRLASVELSPAGGFALVRYGDPVASSGKPGARARYLVLDLHKGASLAVEVDWWQNLRWLGEDHLLSDNGGGMPRIINRDGTGARPLLAE